MDCSPLGSSVHGILQEEYWSHSLLQGIFPTQVLNPRLPQCRQILYIWATQEVPQYALNLTQYFNPLDKGASHAFCFCEITEVWRQNNSVNNSMKKAGKVSKGLDVWVPSQQWYVWLQSIHGQFWSSIFECGHVCSLVVVVRIGVSSDGQIFCDSKIMREGNARKKV